MVTLYGEEERRGGLGLWVVVVVAGGGVVVGSKGERRRKNVESPYENWRLCSPPPRFAVNVWLYPMCAAPAGTINNHTKFHECLLEGKRSVVLGGGGETGLDFVCVDLSSSRGCRRHFFFVLLVDACVSRG